MATRTLTSKNATIRNNGESRLVIGPPPKSERSKATGRHASSNVQIVGTPRDQAENIPADKRLENVAEVPKELLKSEAMQAVLEATNSKVVG